MKRYTASLAATCCLIAMSSIAQTPYKIVDQWKLGGTGGWDYLLADGAAHRLYITHNGRVEVVDTATGKAVGAVTGLKSTHGVALDPDGKTGYISDGAGNAVVIFDRSTFAVLATIPAGTNPDGIAYEPTTKTVWAFNGRSNNVSVIDPAKKEVVATIALPGKPEFPQVDGKGSIFVNIEDKNSIVKLDAAGKKAVATWALPGCESPSGMALDSDHSRLFSVCDGNKMPVTDAKTGKQIALATIGAGPDAAGYDAKAQLAFSSNGETGTLSVVDAANGYKTVQTLATKKGARTMAYDATNNRIYLMTAEYGAPAAGSKRPSVLPDTFTVLVVGK
ncbi:YncE family protein [Terriglobus roseus]|uniref:40-residue YVTN family beta-propeller repeat-containing protein n=1 Tax=Terriglobus roseus TaxID=392734 RepID=A0A1H4JAM6_9BACT|nr:YncE family protein [Terriglobus roseus]SEB43379.1 40-residue YVTN family beta-propeller repeat-containing protein [Terriglobus roseus]